MRLRSVYDCSLSIGSSASVYRIEKIGNLTREYRPREALAAHVNFVKVQQHMPADHWSPETKLRTESRKQKNLVDLMLYCDIGGTRQYLVKNHSPLGVERRLKQQISGHRSAACTADSRQWKWREAFELCGLHQIQRQIIGVNASRRHSTQHALNHQQENCKCRQHAARCGHRQRLQNILRNQQHAVPHPRKRGPRQPPPRCLRLNPQRQVRRWADRFYTGQMVRQQTVALQFLAAVRARTQMFPQV